MRSTITQAVVILAIAGAVGAFFALSRPPRLSAPPAETTPTAPRAAEPAKAEPKPAASTSSAKATTAAPPSAAPAAPVAQPLPQPSPKAPPAATPTPAPAPAPANPPSTPPATPSAAPATAELTKAEREIGFRFVDVAWARRIHQDQILDGQNVVFIDARTFKDFTEGHVPGAMHVDKRYFDGAAPAKVRNYLPGAAVVVYCGGADCTDSEAVVVRLRALNLGIGPYYIIKDGLPGWKAAGHPIATGGEIGFQ